MKKLFICLLFVFGCSIPLIASEPLTITVLAHDISQAVKQGNPNSFTIGFRLVCVTAAADTVIDRVFTERFHSGESPGQFRKRIGDKMQIAIDAYQAEHTIFNSAAFTATPAILEAGLDGGA